MKNEERKHITGSTGTNFELQQERQKCDVKLKQLQNQGKKLEKLANEKERKRRNHRLI